MLICSSEIRRSISCTNSQHFLYCWKATSVSYCRYRSCLLHHCNFFRCFNTTGPVCSYNHWSEL